MIVRLSVRHRDGHVPIICEDPFRLVVGVRNRRQFGDPQLHSKMLLKLDDDYGYELVRVQESDT